MPLTEDALAASIVHTLREPVLVLNSGMEVVVANPAFYRTFSVDEEETVGRLLYDLGNGQWNIPQLRELLEVILPTQNPFEGFRVEHDFEHIGSKCMLLNARKLHEQDLILLAIEDTTDRLTAERKQVESEQLYREMVDAVRDYAIFAIHPDGTVATWNEGCERVKGWKAEEVIGQYFGVFHVREDRESGHPEKELEIAKRDGRFAEEGIRIRQDGSKYWASVTLTAVRNDAGDVIRLTKVVQNIDARKQAEQALAEANRRKDEFLAMLAHELRNPLAPILSAVQLMREYPDRERNERACTTIERQTRHLTRLVDDLLDVARITHGSVFLRKERVDLVELLRRAAESALPLFESRRHRLDLSLPRELLCVEGDPMRLDQVLSNLLHNAAKYTQPGGLVRLVLERNADTAVITVRDTGCGIPASFLPHIFDLFTQGERSLSRSEGGLGIGLNVVRRLVELHGGTIHAESSGIPGEGTAFVLRLPCCKQPVGSVAAREDGATTTSAPRLNILVVDDNTDAADTMGELLEVWGHAVQVVHTGEAALAASRQKLPDLLLCDLGLPGMDGCEVARQIDALRGGLQVVKAAVTGYATEEDRRRTRDAGFGYHLAKPVDPDDLRAILIAAATGRAGKVRAETPAGLLGKHRLSDEAAAR